ncbi:hypothetical protein CDQ91_14885 [Sphingopyxis witflariensis]|uniref:Uncharacterized protein n=2 Tax=Sphingopyxis witflariensis TaxID=173675 RepID=A0A2D0ANT1_9SPHN|nr:hypothetical protein CDQ91_14885 [Sphingopyxis witflariensis]
MEIDLRPYEVGSFVIEVVAPALAAAAPLLIELPLSSLWTYVVERVFRPVEDDNLRQALSTQRELLELFENRIAGQEQLMQRTLDLLMETRARGEALSDQNNELYERLLAETTRRAYLEGRQDELRQISDEQDARLMKMATPLLKEMSVPLRRSAQRAKILVGDEKGQIPILSANRMQIEEVELSVVDPEIQVVLIGIVQYNKETGWGRFRNPEWNGLASFSVSADRKDRLRRDLLEAMDLPETYVSAYYVKTPQGENLRLIVVDIVDIERAEAGLPQYDL